MSDIPELDELLEQHEIFRENMRWEQQEKFQTLGFRLQICAMVTLIAILMIGIIGLLAVPFAWNFAVYVVPKPVRRDPFVRYRRM